MALVFRDLRWAVRTLRQHPVATIAIVLTLALGIGATTAIFSFINALLLRPLPFDHQDRLVHISSRAGGARGLLTAREMNELQQRVETVDVLGSYYPSQYNLSGGGTPESLPTTINSAGFFRALGIRPAIGELWTEDRVASVFEVVLTHELWVRRYGADPSIVGRSVTLDGRPYQVLGVLPPAAVFPTTVQLYRSMSRWADPSQQDVRRAHVVGRLRPGTTVEATQAAFDVVARRLEQELPVLNRGVRFEVVPLRDYYAGSARPYLLLLLIAVGLVQLIVAANVVNLLLARAAGREQATAIRLALGASRAQIVRGVLTESVLLALVGGLAGLVLAQWAAQVLTRIVGASWPLWLTVDLDLRVLAFCLVVSCATGLVAGAAPAAHTAASGVAGVLRDGTRGAVGSRRALRLRGLFVSMQMALALVVLVGAGLTLRTLDGLQRAQLGFDPHDLVTFRSDPPGFKYGTLAAINVFWKDAIERLGRIPGVQAVAINNFLPLANHAISTETIQLEGQPEEDRQNVPFVALQTISPRYFDAMRIPLQRGRVFSNLDTGTARPVAVLGERLANRLWPGVDPIGRRFKLGARLTWSDQDGVSPYIEVIGVVGSVQHGSVTDTSSMDVYLPFEQFYAADGYVVLRMQPGWSARALAGLTPSVREAVEGADPDQSIFDIDTMDNRIADRLWQQRFTSLLFSLFGVLALVLASVGVYAVLSFTVAQQTREIGVRMAIGAERTDVVRHVVMYAARSVVPGLAVGAALAVGLARTARALLFEVSPTDVAALGGAVALLVAVAAVAIAIPALRAAQVDPIVALRNR